MTMADTNALLQRTVHYSNRDTLTLGWMFELFQDEYSKNNVNIMREFNLEALKEHWPTFSAQYVGITEMSCEQIKFEGISLKYITKISAIRIVDERPDYRLFENNCQNFAKYLLERICPGVAIPDTIQMVLERLKNAISPDAKTGKLPGTYPRSTVSLSGCTSYVTASGTIWVTAVEYCSIVDPEPEDSDHLQERDRDNSPKPVKQSVGIIAQVGAAVRKTLGGKMIVHTAVLSGNLKRLTALLNLGADLSIKDKFGDTALHVAVQMDNVEAVKVMLKANADIMSRNSSGATPLHYAVGEEVVTLLLDAGADISARRSDGRTALHDVTVDSKKSALNALLRAHANLSARENKGMTVLHWAAEKGHVAAVRTLLDAGASVAVENNRGWTPLHFAASEDHIEVMKLLLNAGADPMAQDMDRNSVLHSAAVCFRARAAKVLLEANADISSRTELYDETPLHLAVNAFVPDKFG
jgi:ankyrin repeat protein